jgi:phosphoenolpyruvate carboxykinase (GTP)
MDGSVYWEDLDKVPAVALDWQRRPWSPTAVGADGKKAKAAHPNARFTTPARQCPVVAKEWEDPAGVPISAFLFGGRRKTVVPLANESLSWEHGVFMGATMASEMTAAAIGGAGQLRFDPFAMVPFCGYNMGDYFNHWLKIGKVEGAKLPKIFYVNWFRQDESGKWLWPGFGENSRVLAWIFDRVDNKAAAAETAIGRLPTEAAINFKGLKSVTAADKKALLSVDKDGWLKVIPEMKAHFAKFGERLPAEMAKQLADLETRLNK